MIKAIFKAAFIVAALLIAIGVLSSMMDDATRNPGQSKPPATPRASSSHGTRPLARASEQHEVKIRLVVSDFTENVPVGEKCEVWIRGAGSWFPDLQFGGDSREIGPYSVGDEIDLVVYPEGRAAGGDPETMKVTLTIPDQIISGSDRDAVRVDIFDAKVEVVATSIEGNSATFSRHRARR